MNFIRYKLFQKNYILLKTVHLALFKMKTGSPGKKDKDLSHSILLNAPRDFLNKLGQKCKQENITFVKILKYCPST